MTDDITKHGQLHAQARKTLPSPRLRRRQINALQAELTRLKEQEKQDGFFRYRQSEIRRIDEQKSRFLGQALTITVEDAIFSRLVDADESLTVALGLFADLADDKDNRLFKYHDEIVSARRALTEIISDR